MRVAAYSMPAEGDRVAAVRRGGRRARPDDLRATRRARGDDVPAV